MQGIWSRLYLSTALEHDTTTRVLWLQAGDTHVDLRLSSKCQAMPAVPLQNQGDDALMEIAQQTAFAGSTHIKNNICTWTRKINYQGPQGQPDVGKLEWQDDILIEKGVHEDYEEGWQCDVTGSVEALCLTNDSGQLVFFCTVADHFAIARAHPGNMQSPDTLVEQVAQALSVHDESSLERLFDQEFSFGKLEHGHAVIQASSVPSRVGALACRLDSPLAGLSRIDLSQEHFCGRSDVHSYFVVP